MITISKGYYVSPGKMYEEWHAGIHMKYKIFSAKLFDADNRILVASIQTNIETDEYLFKIGDFQYTSNQHSFGFENSNLCTYSKDGSIYQVFSIVTKYSIMDEFGVLYNYRTFDSEEE
ncbi:MAG: hypothetical protein AAGA77_23880 [Bacteroidota bacterium]